MKLVEVSAPISGGDSAMRMPKRPPPTPWGELTVERIAAIFSAVPGPLVKGEYLHWDKLLHERPPDGLSHQEWWLGLNTCRRSSAKQVPLLDKNDQLFHYVETDPIPEVLHDIDTGAGGLIQMPEQITNPDTRDQYYVGSLIEEAITSSQLEGAATTRPVAKQMIRSGRQPRDRSERMILSNFLTMQRIGKLKQKPLTKEVVFEIHRLVTDRALDDPSAAGRLRREDEPVVVDDVYGEVFHDPPPADQLEERMAAICEFANAAKPFVHPVMRSIILHFWLAYDHPFVDGNGRTARALFYWSMLHHGFWLCEFISISQIIRKAPAKYGRAFLYTETDNNDLTYFIIYHLGVIRRAIRQLHGYIQRKTSQLQVLQATLRGIAVLNHRQRALVDHALRHPHHRYSIESHRMSHNVVYETARSDLLDLRSRGLLDGVKIGKTWQFTPVRDLEERLASL